MKTRDSTRLALAATVFSLAFVASNATAGKPVYADPGFVLLSGSVQADDGDGLAKGTYNVEIKSGKDTTVTIVVRQFLFTPEFAQNVIFQDKFGDRDGATCFAGSSWASGAYRLYDDETAEFSVFPEFFTADGAIQKYHFYLTGFHDVDLPLEDNFPVTGFADVVMDFNQVEITTEGKGQNRRRSCTGVFEFVDEYSEFQGASATFSR